MAKRTVPKPLFDYVDGAAWGEVTYRRNRSAFDALALRPRALVDVSEIEMSTTVLGREIALPIIAPPTGLTGLMHPDGEAAIARAAHARGHDLHAVGALLALDRGGPRGRARAEVVPALRDDRPRARATTCWRARRPRGTRRWC